MTKIEYIKESLRIESIFRDPTPEEIEAHNRFVSREVITIQDLKDFVDVYQPGNGLRSHPGQDVRIGDYFPPKGGPYIPQRLRELLGKFNHNPGFAWENHVQYESLHPFTDCNGRSGRAIWYWCMRVSGQSRLAELGFLHAFYYQTLATSGR